MNFYQFPLRAASFSLLPAHNMIEGWCCNLQICWVISSVTEARNALSTGYILQANIISCHIRIPYWSLSFTNKRNSILLFKNRIILDHDTPTPWKFVKLKNTKKLMNSPLFTVPHGLVTPWMVSEFKEDVHRKQGCNWHSYQQGNDMFTYLIEIITFVHSTSPNSQDIHVRISRWL